MRSRWWSGGITLAGILVAGSAGWHYVVLDAPPTATLHDLVTVTVIGGAALGLGYGGYWHADEGLAPGRYPRIVAWMGASTLLFASVGTIILHSGSRLVLPVELLEAVHIGGSVGLAAGLLVGTLHAQRIRSAEAAARAEAEARALAAQQEHLEELDDLLRHYILNGMQHIIGYAQQLRADGPVDDDTALDIIEDRAEGIVTLIEHVRSISGVEASEAAGVVDPERAIDEAIAQCEPGGAIAVDVAEDVPRVRASDLTEGLALLCHGLTSMIASGGTLAIDGDHDDARVILTITATSLGGSHPLGDSVFQPAGSTPSLQLYLGKLVCDRSGELDVIRRTDDRLEFELTLDRATAGEGGCGTARDGC